MAYRDFSSQEKVRSRRAYGAPKALLKFEAQQHWLGPYAYPV